MNNCLSNIYSHRKWFIVILIGYLISTPAFGLDNLTTVDCRELTTPLTRLRCFDEQLETPLKFSTREKQQKVVTVDSSSDKKVKQLKVLLKKMGTLNEQQLTTYQDNGPGQRRMLAVTAIASDKNNLQPAAILFIQCYQDITSLQILWPQNLDSSWINVRIWSGEKVLSDSAWRIIDDAFLLLAPRGLPSIDISKRLFNQERIIIQGTTDNTQIQTEFNVKGLKQKIQSLGKMCHWL